MSPPPHTTLQTPAPLSTELGAAVDAVWESARARWASALLLSRPTGAPPTLTAPAAMNLATRAVWLNEPVLHARALVPTVEALLAHEVGHHVAYPGSLVMAARLRLTERSLLPFEHFSLVNLFTDLLINERLGRDDAMRAQLVAIYAAFRNDPDPLEAPPPPKAHTSVDDADAAGDPANDRGGPGRAKRARRAQQARLPRRRQNFTFSFVMCVYEELWGLAPSTLLSETHARGLAERFPGARAEAQLLSERLFVLGPNLFTQFLFFLSVLTRYIVVDVDDVEPAGHEPCPCGGGEPSAEDWAEALSPVQQEDEALRRAIAEGWLREDDAARLRDGRDFERRIAGLPGTRDAAANRVPEVMAAWYRRQAASYLLRPPPTRLVGDATVPTDLVPWEPGDAIVDVDWAQTLREHGPRLGRATPLVRTRIADEEGLDAALWAPRTEIYLDVSGSMPDPCAAKNAMSLAAMILAVATLRHHGAVRALLYSHEHVKLWEWSRSEVEVSRFLMHYMGGGTQFPFDVLRASVAERVLLPDGGRVRRIRVVITDRDFDANMSAEPQSDAQLQTAARASAPLVLLQLHADAERQRHYQKLGVTVVDVGAMDDFPGVAAALAHALFPPGRAAARGDHGAA